MRSFMARKTNLIAVLAVLVAALVLPASGAAAADERQARNNIFVSQEKDFNPANGVRSGSGTVRDPYVISGWDVSHVEIRDTASHVLIKDNKIDRLVLDWIGDGATVRDNEVGDLRVNQNRKRTGEATSGLIEDNTFGLVGQLRHFDGIFQDNVVGGKDEMIELPFNGRAVNFDGFNGSIFRNNVIYGYMDARLHGHHHSSGFSEHSHYHGAGREPGAMDHDTMDHTVRYHQVHIYGNKIHSDNYYALAYLDTVHSANDRTAASETEESLNAPHVHYTRVFIHDNELIGSGLAVDIFNAKDERHKATARGLIELARNKITLTRSDDLFRVFSGELSGIDIGRAVDATVRILDNTIVGPPAGDPVAGAKDEWERVVGVNLWDLNKGDVYLSGNSISQAAYGIKASRFTKTVNWWIQELSTTDVDEEVYWDSSVENPPERRP
ncbi:MAG: hypothetical protein M3273_00915 [Actinomycetota bacterium]|nr:hypothetical protein [Actinomycetota bacterium]